MMKIRKIIMFNLLFVALLLSACGGAPAASTAAPTVDATGLVTMVAQTLQAQFTQTAVHQPTATSLPQTPPTATLLPTALPQASPTSFSLPTVVMATATTKPVISSGTSAAPAAAPALFAVTSVVTGVNNAGMANACPPGYTFNFSATITANGPGTVTYDWEFSNGVKSDVQTLEYSAAGSQVVTTGWTLGNEGEVPVGETYKGWARITIIEPNHQVFPRASFTMQCTS